MILPNFIKNFPRTLMALTVALTGALGLSGCGGGGGGEDSALAQQPAPQTFNGLRLTLYGGGFTLTFIRSEGDALTGVEIGAVSLEAGNSNTLLVDSNGQNSTLAPSLVISGARYTYVRTSPEAGTLTIEGSANGISLPYGPNPQSTNANYLDGPTFKRTFYVLFGTDGTSITGITVNDVGQTDALNFLIPYPGITWTGASLRLFSGTSVPVAWTLKDSQGLNLPTFYPDSISQQRLQITPTGAPDWTVGYQFLNSTFTRFSNGAGDFLEQGVGNKDVSPDPTLILINFEYQPDPATVNRAKIRIFEGALPTVIYDMTFLDLEKGTYVREDGSTGTFEFPFLDN